MPQLFYYLLKVIICSGILFGYYHLFLRNKVYHSYNRFYLLAAILLSLTVPLLNFNINAETTALKPQPIVLLEAVNSGEVFIEEAIIYNHKKNISSVEVISWLYAFVSLILLILFTQVLLRIRAIIRKNNKQRINEIIFISSTAKGTPFSFLKYLFWNSDIDINSETGQQVFAHEVAHIKEKHSIDKIMINLLLVFFWANPIFWLMRKELNLIHEFIADKKAVGEHDASALAAMIIQTAYPQHNFLLANHFFYSPIKRRLKMLTKYKTTKAGYFARILALPLILFMAAAFTLKTKQLIQNVTADKPIIVVIDAGHGGSDPGARGADGTFEKDISLLLAQKIKALNTDKNLKIILTRESDIYMTPKEKAGVANSINADLLISIHVSSGPEASRNKATGMEVFLARDESNHSSRSKLLGSAIIAAFNTNYNLPVKPFPVQSKNSVMVLQSANCPSVIIEAGYMTNKNDLSYLRSEAARDVFAKNVLNAIAQYQLQKDSYIEKENNIAEKEVIKKPDTIPSYKTLLNKIDKDIYVDASQEISVPGPNYIQISKINYKEYSKENQPLYIVNGREVKHSQVLRIQSSEIREIRVFKPATAMPTYGRKALNGAIIINTVDGNTSTTAKVPATPQEPSITLSGISDPKIHIDQLKNIMEVRSSNPDYTFVSATLFFTGAGFPNVIMAKLTGGSLKPLSEYMSRIAAGSTVTFDNIRVAKQDGSGEMVIKGRSFSFYDNEKGVSLLEIRHRKRLLPAEAENRNVFYIGIDNPISITVTNLHPDKLIAKISNGSISGSNGEFKVRVNTVGEATIEVFMVKDGKEELLGTRTMQIERLSDEMIKPRKDQ